MSEDSNIYIAGHRGMAGSAIYRKLIEKGYTNFVLRTSKELDLTVQADVEQFFNKEKPDIVILAAAKVGGIMANIQSPAVFLYDNLMIQNNIINSAYKNGVKKLVFLGSSCIYPRECPQPMKEEYLLDGKVEPTNEGYAIAKIAGIKLCEMYNRQYGTDYISIMPCNLYGIGDSFDLVRSHVVAATIRKFHEAKINNSPTVTIWGTGKARRELLFVDDMADACVYLMESYSGNDFFNVGTGSDVSITDLSLIVKDIVGYEGELVYDKTKPDGMPQKLMDCSKLTENGWKYQTELRDGIAKTYQWYIDNYERFN
ncbi:GDP-L-fucose synthase family protein [Acetobacterium sp.]|uniref:GDP-L-fucose synthase family protein n=1 Tax=Acetobacterium sp. TaxID=1872094 RepID=UPI0035947B75